MKRLGFAAGLVLPVACLVLAGCLSTGRTAGAAAPAADDGWDLVFSDDFNRAELGGDWQVVDGNWTIENGSLAGSGAIVSSRGFPAGHPAGFLRLEFEAVTNVKPFILMPGGPPPVVSVSDMSSFIHAQPPETAGPVWQTGYFFQFGGFMNTQNRIRRAGQELVADGSPKKLITPDKVHRVVVENDQGTLRLIVDGELLLEQADRASIAGEGYDRVGFYFYTAAKVNYVKVYTKRLPDDLI